MQAIRLAGAGHAVHRYEPHVDDWSEGDPDWGYGAGRGIIGALNFVLSARGLSRCTSTVRTHHRNPVSEHYAVGEGAGVPALKLVTLHLIG